MAIKMYNKKTGKVVDVNDDKVAAAKMNGLMLYAEYEKDKKMKETIYFRHPLYEQIGVIASNGNWAPDMENKGFVRCPKDWKPVKKEKAKE